MALYDGSQTGQPAKYAPGDDTPDMAVDMADWRRTEPLLTADRLREEFLFGIPLVSPNRDPITGKAMWMSDALLDRIIKKSVSIAEEEAMIDIFPVERKEKLPFDRAEYEAWGYMKLGRKPVSSIENLTVTPSNEVDVYQVPLEWVDVGLLRKGFIFLIPLTVVMTNGSVVNSQSAGGALFLSILGNRPWVPAFWEVLYTSGFRNGALPVLVNELIGTIAAMNILSQLAAAHAIDQSFSLGLDGASQSISTPGPKVFKDRLEELAADRAKYVKKLKIITGSGGIFTGNV